MKKGKSNPTG